MFVDRWDVVEGFRVHSHADPGPRDKPPLVLVHGLGVSSRYLLPTGELLLDGYAVYALNLPGFGASDKPPRALGLERLTDVLGAWLDTVSLEEPIFLANSYGCQIAVELATRRRLAGLVLVGPTVDRFRRSNVRQLLGLARDSFSEPLALTALVVRDYPRAGPLRVWRTAQDALADRIEDKIGGLELPILIVIGERDGFVSERWARELAARAPNGRLEIVRGAAHAVNFNSPAALAELVKEFAGTRAASR